MKVKKVKISNIIGIFLIICMMTICFSGCSLLGKSNIVNIYQTGNNGDVVNTYDGLIDTIENIEDSVVEVYAALSNQTSCGSGVIIDTTGEDNNNPNRFFVVTNFHVIEDGYSFVVKFTRWDKKFSAQLVGGDKISDIAVLMFETTECDDNCECKSSTSETKCTDECSTSCSCGCNVKGVQFANSDNLKLGQTCIVIGNPLGSLGGSVSIGNISYLNREVSVENNDMTLIQTTANINSGNSGGGMFDTNGNLIGIVNAKASGTGIEGIGFAIPSNEVLDKVSKLIATSQISDSGVVTEYGYVEGRTNYGITADYSSNSSAVYISSISSDSAFYNIKGSYSKTYNGLTIGYTTLQTSDTVYRINGVIITNLDKYKEEVNKFAVGSKVTLVVKRSDYFISFTVTLSQYHYTLPSL